MIRPVLLAVDDEAAPLAAVERELTRRYSADYEVRCERSAETALGLLRALRDEGRPVALLLADSRMPGMDGSEFLLRAHRLHPGARRGLLIDWGDQSAAPAILRSIALDIVDAYTPKPWSSPDEEFHRFVTGFLEDWSRENRPQFEMARVVGDRWSPRCHELRDLLNRNGIPYGFYDAETPQGRAIAAGAGREGSPLPLVVLYDGQVLNDPSNVELADALDACTVYDLVDAPSGGGADLIIVGAGPAGLSAAVYGASEGLRTTVVEMEAIGGQAGTSSRIRNYLGFPTGIPGRELAARAYRQAWLFGAGFLFVREARGLRAEGGRGLVRLADGTELAGRAVVLAMGVSYRRLSAPGLERLAGAGVFYGAASSEASAMRGLDVYIVGGGNSAGQAAVHLARYARRVVLLVRGAALAEGMSDYLVREIESGAAVEVRTDAEVTDGGGDSRLEWLELRDAGTGRTERVPASALFVLIGAEPRTGWLPPEVRRDGRGYILTGSDLPAEARPAGRPPLEFETGLPGVFAVGDVRHRSVKRVASAVGEGSMVIQAVHRWLGEGGAATRA